MTRYKFLERARDIHGYKYQYPNLSDKILSKDNNSSIKWYWIYKKWLSI
jgi:hypothetical protein